MHSNTRLTSYTRGRMMQEYVGGTSVQGLAQRYGISRTTFYRWRKRFLAEGERGLQDRSCRPHRVRYRLTSAQVDRVVELRLSSRLGPLRLMPLLSVPPTTLYRCLRRRGLGRLPKPPRPAVVRYEAGAPGQLVHLDVLHLFAVKGQKQAHQFTLVDVIPVWPMPPSPPGEQQQLPWVDLQAKAFYAGPIGVPGAWDYGLKESLRPSTVLTLLWV